MRKLFFILSIVVIAFTLESCLDNENSIISTNIIDLTAGPLPDTVIINTTIPVSLRASVPNSCWHSIEIYKEIAKDTIVGFWAKATFENHGENCTDVITTKDTVINVTLTMTKPYVFEIIEAYNKVRKDTVFVKIQ